MPRGSPASARRRERDVGEYWKPINLTKREFIHPHELGCGLKLGEWHHHDSLVMRRVQELLDQGRWSPTDDIRILSDYGGEMQMYGQPREEAEGHYKATYGADEQENEDAPVYRDVSRG